MSRLTQIKNKLTATQQEYFERYIYLIEEILEDETLTENEKNELGDAFCEVLNNE